MAQEAFYLNINTPVYIKTVDRSAFANSVVESDCILLFSQDGQTLIGKNHEGSFETIGGTAVRAGVIVSDSGTLKIQPLSFNGTVPSDSGALEAFSDSSLMIFETGHAEPDYGGSSPGASMDFYKCTYVNSDSWGGRKAVLNSGVYSFQSNSTEGLTYSSITPIVNSIYTDGALQKISYIPLDTLNEGLVFYAPFTSVEQIAATGQELQFQTSDHNITSTVKDGVPCLFSLSVGNDNDQFGVTCSDAGMPMGTDPCTMSIWTCWASIPIREYWTNVFAYSSLQKPSCRDLGFYCDSYGKLSAYIGRVDDSITLFQSPTKWHHWCLVYQNQTVRFYLDGVQLASYSYQFDSFSACIGISGNSYADLYFTAARIYNRALSDFEIRMLANEFTPTA